MSLTISIRFLTGRAHLHPWQTHHSEGRVEWPPSQWRLLRSIVAVAGRGLTSLPYPDDFATPKQKRTPPPFAVADLAEDEIPFARLTDLLAQLITTPYIWLPRTSGGHTRQYFPIQEAGIVKNTGAAVFDTFATIHKEQPIVFHWPGASLDQELQIYLRRILDRMTYFGRAESWSCVTAAKTAIEETEAVVTDGPTRTHWRSVCIEDHGRPDGREYREYTLERRLAPAKDLKAEAVELLPRTAAPDGKKRKDTETFKETLQSETSEKVLLRCLLRESGQDIRDGLERPIGTRWIHYAVPRAIYEVPRPRLQNQARTHESVNLVRYSLNTATVNRAVLPPVTDTLTIADRFRSAVMALHGQPSRNLSGHEADGAPRDDNRHASWWPMDEDNDGFIDHVMVLAPGGFDLRETDALRRLTRLRQRGGRPDLLVIPTFVGEAANYRWLSKPAGNGNSHGVTTFISATPYFCPVHLSHGRGKAGCLRPVLPELLKSLRIQGIIAEDDEVKAIYEFVFDYAPMELAATARAMAEGRLVEPVPPRQFFPVIDLPEQFPPLPRIDLAVHRSFIGASLKDPDDAFPFGLSIGFTVCEGNRFIRAGSFGRRRRERQVKGPGRMFRIEFHQPREPRPFAIGDQCHYGLGLFIPSD
ncbi:MAG: type I-U CRISPR-associated protein Cas5/Cas6 [Acidobacteriales bacterium]|nr:type I-U CRISPR-associated protein Cas5/Cas6 [Terriglobales bacterium]